MGGTDELSDRRFPACQIMAFLVMVQRMKPSYRVLAVSAALALRLVLTACGDPPASKPAPVRIMPLGDSITQGRADKESYRRPLWLKLKAVKAPVDFVGSLRINHMGPSRYDDYDMDHEGHWAWQADEVLAQIDAWAAQAKPDIVLMHLGTNDLGHGQDPAAVAGELKEIIERIRKRNPSVTVLVAQVIPLAHPQANSRIEALNKEIAVMTRHVTTKESPVIAVDQYTGFDAWTDTYDGIHPNDKGIEKMADRWFRALADVWKLPQQPAKTE